MPTIYVIAGPNGVGETTFADRCLPDEARQVEFVNANLIARGLSPCDPDAVAMDAGRIRQLIADKAGFTWETSEDGQMKALKPGETEPYEQRGIRNLEHINRKIAELQKLSPETLASTGRRRNNFH